MMLPKKLKIGGFNFKIILEPCDNYGEMSKNYSRITIDSNSNPDVQIVALIHEILHALNGELSEVVIDGLAHQIFALLKDNKLMGSSAKQKRQSVKRRRRKKIQKRDRYKKK